MPSSLLCACCPKSSTLVCSACKSAGLQVAYCSVKHQKLVWSTHKLICGRVLEQCFIPPISQLETVIELLHNPGLPYSSLAFEVSEDAYNLNCWTPGLRELALQIHEQRISTTVNLGATFGRRGDLVNLIKAYRYGKLHLIPRPRIPPVIPLYLQAYHMLNDCLKTLIFKIPPDDWTRTLSIPSLIEYTNSIVIYATVYVQSGLVGGVIKFKDVPIDLQSSLRELWERVRLAFERAAIAAGRTLVEIARDTFSGNQSYMGSNLELSLWCFWRLIDPEFKWVALATFKPAMIPIGGGKLLGMLPR